MGEITTDEVFPINPPWTEIPLPQLREHTENFLMRGKRVDHGDIIGEYLSAGKVAMTEKFVGIIGRCDSTNASKADLKYIDWLISSNTGHGDPSGEVVGAFEIQSDIGPNGMLLAVRFTSVPRFLRAQKYIGDEESPEIFLLVCVKLLLPVIWTWYLSGRKQESQKMSEGEQNIQGLMDNLKQ